MHVGVIVKQWINTMSRKFLTQRDGGGDNNVPVTASWA